MVIPALLATALTACPQAPAPTPNVAPAPTQEQQIEARGLSTPKDMMLHGILAGNSFQSNQGFTLQNGSSVHANTGLILNSRNIVLNGGQVSSTSTATCSDNSGMGFCLKGKPKFIAPMVVIPKADIPALKTKYSATPSITIQGNLNLNSSSEISTKFDNQIILVKGSVNLNAVATIKNATILVEETLSSNKGISLENTRIISKGIGLNQATKLNNSRIITDEDLTVNGTLESLGVGSLISSKNITTNQTSSSTTGELAIITNQNMTMNQSSSGKIAVWANGNVNLNQVSSLEGNVVAGGKVTLNQRVTLTKVLQHVNEDILGGGQIPYGTREEGTLIAQQEWVSSLGVSVYAGTITRANRAFVEVVDPATISEKFAAHFEVVGNYYRIGGVGDIVGGGVQLGLPIPNGVDKQGLFIVGLFSDIGLTDIVPTGRYSWDSLTQQIPGTDERKIYGALAGLAREGEIFVLIKPRNTLTNQSQPVLRIQQQNVTVECKTGLLEVPEVCDPNNTSITNRQAVLDGLIATISTTATTQWNDLIQTMQLTTQDLTPSVTIPTKFTKKIILTKTEGVSCPTGNFGSYRQQNANIILCVKSDGSLVSLFPEKLLRHELFHAVQYSFLPARQFLDSTNEFADFLIESTATLAVESTSNVVTYDSQKEARSVVPQVVLPQRFLNSDRRNLLFQSAYRFQDFFVFLSKQTEMKLVDLKNLFQKIGALQINSGGQVNLINVLDQFIKEIITNKTNPITGQCEKDLGASTCKEYNPYKTAGLSLAYWEWAKNQSIEKSVDIRNWGNRKKCSLDMLTTLPDLTRNSSGVFAGNSLIHPMGSPISEFNSSNFRQIDGWSGSTPDIAPLETRALRISFDGLGNANLRNIPLEFTVTKSNGAPVDPNRIRYKWYKFDEDNCTLPEQSAWTFAPSPFLGRNPNVVVLSISLKSFRF